MRLLAFEILSLAVLRPLFSVAARPASSLPCDGSRGSAATTLVMMAPGSSKKPSRAQFKASSYNKYHRNNWRDVENRGGPHLHVEAPTLHTQSLPASDSTDRLSGRYPALVLNADYTPLSYVPLSLWSWQDTVRAIFRDAVIVLSNYDGVVVRSPSVTMPLPSVIVLKTYVQPSKPGKGSPGFTRRNLYLRDNFCCQYCRRQLLPSQLTYDHVVPRVKQVIATDGH